MAPSAEIGGDLVYVSDEPAQIRDGAVIDGSVIAESVLAPNVRIRALSLMVRVLVGLAIVALGLGLIWSFPQRSREAAQAVFERVSFDLIYARQNQSAADWRAELTEALALAPGHLSLYQLTIEDGTAFGERYRRGALRDHRRGAPLAGGPIGRNR